MNGHSADQGCALAHTAGQLGGFFIFKGVKAVVGEKFQDIFAVGLCECVPEFQAENDVLIDGTPFKKMVALQHVTDSERIIVTTVRETSALIEQGALFRIEQAGYDGEQGGFTDSAVMEMFNALKNEVDFKL